MAGLSDADVFGTTPPVGAPPSVLSDADIFGSGPKTTPLSPTSQSSMSDAQVFAPNNPGITDYLGEIGKRFARDVVETTVASPLKGLATLPPDVLMEPDQMLAEAQARMARGSDPSMFQNSELGIVASNPLYHAGEAVSEATKRVLPDANILHPLVSDVAGGFGSVAANIATSMIPFAGPGLTVLSNLSGQGMGQGAEDAIKVGATDDQVRRAASLGNFAGATEFVDALLPAFLGNTGKALGFVKRVGLRVAEGAFIEGGQEGLQQFIQNAIAKGIYAPNKDLTESVAYNALVGAIVGGGTGAVLGGHKAEAQATPPTPQTIQTSVQAPTVEPSMPVPGAPPITMSSTGPLDINAPARLPGETRLLTANETPPAPTPNPTQVIQTELAHLQGLQTQYATQLQQAPDPVEAAKARMGLDYVNRRIPELQTMLTPTVEETKARTLSPQIVDFVNKEAGLQVPSEPSKIGFSDLIRSQSLQPQAEEIQSSPGANTARLAKLLGPKLYGDPSNLSSVSVKEMFQNAFDAVKGTLEKKGDTEGNVAVTMDPKTRTISVSDDGSGMTPEVLGKQFLEIAGTHKETKRASGGLGIAKMLFIFGNKALSVKTMRDGKVAELNTTGEQLFSALDDKSKAPNIQVRIATTQDLEQFPKGRGTIVQVKVPEQYNDSSTGEVKKIDFNTEAFYHPDLIKSPLFDNINVTFNGRPLPIGNQFPLENYTQFANVNFNWGSARIYITKDAKNQHGSTNAHILSNGLWQFSDKVQREPGNWMSALIPYHLYMDVNPKVAPEEAGYPFDLNRQGFSPATRKDVQNIFNYIGLLYQRAGLEEVVSNFGSMQFLDYDPKTKGVTASQTIKVEPKAPPPSNALTLIHPGDRVRVEDGQLIVNGREVPELTPQEIEKYKLNPDELRIPQEEIDPRRVILHDNTDIVVSPIETRAVTDYGREKFGKRFDEYVFAIGNAFKELRDVVVRYMPAPVVDLKTPPLGLSEKALALWNRTVGKQVNEYEDLAKEGIGISFDPEYRGVSIKIPFSGMFINPAVPEYSDPVRAAVGMVGTMVHELAHYKVRSHGAEFPAEMQRILIMLDSNPSFNYHAFKQKVVNVTSAYEDILKHMNGVYTSGDFTIRPRGKRFEDSRSDQARNGSPLDDVAGPRGQPEGGSRLADWVTASKAIPASESGRSGPAFETVPSRSSRPSDNGRAANYNAVRHIDLGISAVPQQDDLRAIRDGTSAIMGGPTPELKEAASHADRFNWMYKYLAGITQLLDGNPYFNPLRKYVERVRQMHSDETKIHDAALRLMKDWRHLGQQSNNLQALIQDVQEMPYLTLQERKAQLWRHPTTQEFSDLVQKHKVSEEALGVYNRIRQMDETFLRLLEQESIENARRRIQDPVKLANKIDEIQMTGNLARAKPFFPFTRFGRYYVTVKDAAGKVVHFETFEPRRFVGITTKRAEKYQQAQVKILEAKVPPGHVVKSGVLPETAEPLVGLPSLLLDLMQGADIGLTSNQVEAMKLMQNSRNPAMSLKDRAPYGDRSLTGHSLDLPRAFAKYFFHGGRYFAKVRHAWALRGHIAEAQLTPGNKAGLIASQMGDHLQNTVLDARGDFGFFKGAIFLWAMGYVPAAATQNLTQTPMITYPFLAAKFGDLRATRHVVQSMVDLTNYYKRGKYDNQTDFEMKALGYGIKTGRISETQAPELAGMAGGGNLISGMGGTKLERGAVAFQEKAAWMFEMAEQFNRRVAYRAALRLAQELPQAKFVEESVQKYNAEYQQLVAEFGSEARARAVVSAIHTVDQTQFVYAKYARSRLFRGPKNIFFVFKQYMASTLWMLGNNKSDVLPRYLVTAMLMGGLGGVPGWDDMKSIFRAIGRWFFGKDVNIERTIRDYVLQWSDGRVSPDLVLHGLARRGFGLPAMVDAMGSLVTGAPGRSLTDPKFQHSSNVPMPVLDRSKAISMGNILPIDLGKMMEPTQQLDKTISDQTTKASGAVFSVGFNLYKAIMDVDNPAGDYKRWEKTMPRALSSASRSYRAFTEGRERGKGGPNSASTIVNYDPRDTEQMMEAIAMAGGYQPLRQQAKWDYILAQAEVRAFYDFQRKELLDQFFEAMHGKNPVEVTKVRDEIVKFNRELPDYAKARAISGDTIRASMGTRERALVSKDIGIPTQRTNIGISQEMQRLFPEATIDVRRVR